MNAEAARRAESRATVLFALAEALVEPQSGLQALLHEAAGTGAEILGSEACRWAQAEMDAASTGPHAEAQLQADYIQAVYATTGPRGDSRPLPLYESLFLEGRLMGPATLEVERCYQALGLAPIQGELPDHASVELAFLGSLAAAEVEAYRDGDLQRLAQLRREYRRFLRSHAARWLPQIGRALAAGDAPLYRVVGRWLDSFLGEEVKGRIRNRRAAETKGAETRPGYLIVLRTPDACTLCGLCTGCCQPGALRIQETQQETALTFAQDQCVGCRQCIPICPESVLCLEEVSSAGAAPRQSLRASRRLTCPNCGEPTVSEAEWRGVLARIQLAPEMQARLQLCVACKLQVGALAFA